MSQKPPRRIEAIDFVRGLGVVAMVLFHTSDSFYRGGSDGFSRVSHFIGGGAAPIFLTLAGLGVALAWRQGARPSKLAGRGLEVLIIGLCFRFQEWALGGEGARSLSLLRVDVLNCIGVSITFIAGVLSLLRRWRESASPLPPVLMGLLGAAIILVTPRIAVANLNDWPRALAYYFAGPRDFALFPLFGWAGVACVGAAAGLWATRVREETAAALVRAGRVALGLYLMVLPARVIWGDALGFVRADQNPLFTCERLLFALGLVSVASWGQWPRAVSNVVVNLGTHSLLIYCVHVELVYGLWLFRFHHQLAELATTLLATAVLAAMIALSFVITPSMRYVERGGRFLRYERD